MWIGLAPVGNGGLQCADGGEQSCGCSMGGGAELEHMLLCLSDITCTPSAHSWRSAASVSPQPGHALLGGEQVVVEAETKGGEVTRKTRYPGQPPSVRPVDGSVE